MLYEKYEPKSINDIKGCYQIKKYFHKPIHRVPNMIFLGPTGTGKTTVAKFFLKHLSSKGNYVHFTQYDYRGNKTTFVNNIVTDYCISMPRNGGRWKTLCFDEADTLTEFQLTRIAGLMDTFGRIRRFIFIANKPLVDEKLVSRCKVIYFSKISRKHLMEKLKEVCVEENIKVSSKILNKIVKESKGDMRQACNALEDYRE